MALGSYGSRPSWQPVALHVRSRRLGRKSAVEAYPRVSHGIGVGFSCPSAGLTELLHALEECLAVHLHLKSSAHASQLYASGSLGLNLKTPGAKEVTPAAIHCKLTLMHSLLPFGMTRQSSQSGTSPLARESKVYLPIVSK